MKFMTKGSLSLFSAILLLSGCIFYASYSPTAQLEKQYQPTRQETLPATKLRGYGTLSGNFSEFQIEGSKLSILDVTAENAARAKIVHAKYQSDLCSMGGVKQKQLDISGNSIPANVVRTQGLTVSARKDNRVFIISADSEDALKQGLELTGLASSTDIEFTPSGKVPMYLDSWDQHAFRFYYRPWEKLESVKTEEFNPISEFDYAKEHGDLGFVFWANPQKMDFAENMLAENWWDWAARAAEKRNLPMVINTSCGPGTWFLNQYRDQTIGKMPQYTGSFHSIGSPYLGGEGFQSWCSTTAKDAELALVQRYVKEYSKKPNTIEFLEPHGELRHGHQFLFLEYGPLADTNYRQYLKSTYGSLDKLNQRWYGAGKLSNWDDIRVPEIASFLGWDPKTSIDLTGTWQVEFTDAPGKWHNLVAPGHDRAMFMPHKPANYKRQIDIPAGWLKDNPKNWIYVWDMNKGVHHKEKITVSINGKLLKEDLVVHNTPHWVAVDTSKALKTGTNTIEFQVPKGYVAYRVYLSGHEPKQYPYLGVHKNAQWVDFVNWVISTRLNTVKRGVSMIREADPDKSIVFMAPDAFMSSIKDVCEQYGGRFHNTGHMGAFWNEKLPMLMRGADLPFSLEPGGPAKDLVGFKKMMGRYATEGVNAIHYFIHIGSIIWNDDIRNCFESLLPLLKTLGRMHSPKAEAALLMSNRVNNLTDYPWGSDLNTKLPTGYFRWKVNEYLLDNYQMDAVTDDDFIAGKRIPYHMIVDTNTCIMNRDTVSKIRNWVKQGGIFVTFVQTGRHTETEANAWPISDLTGYDVTSISQYKEDGNPVKWDKLKFADGQTVFDPQKLELGKARGNGLKLKKVAPECQDLMLWEDGSVAVGLRPLGKGYVINLGMKFAGDRIWFHGTQYTSELFHEIFQWAKIKTIPATAPGVILRHYVSNNGLYDVWSMWNRSDKPQTPTFTFLNHNKPAFCQNIADGRNMLISSDDDTASISGLKFGPWDTTMLQTPRNQIADASLNWLKLQRNWWRGTTPVKPLPKTEPMPGNALDLVKGWSTRSGKGVAAEQLAAFSKIGFDDAKWQKREMEVWTEDDNLGNELVFRKEFTVPQKWQNGRIKFWLSSWFSSTHFGDMEVWLDGEKLATPSTNNGIKGLDVTDKLKPGTPHCLTVKITGSGKIYGVRGESHLAFIPSPKDQQDLSGQWELSQDVMDYDKKVDLPGKTRGASIRRTIKIDKSHAGQQVYVNTVGSDDLICVIINGTMVRRHHHCLGDTTHLNITPWVKFGADNEIELVKWQRPGNLEVKSIKLYYY